eukprot:8471213-Alexandrium_andersonii.AAC.1
MARVCGSATVTSVDILTAEEYHTSPQYHHTDQVDRFPAIALKFTDVHMRPVGHGHVEIVP